MTVGQAEYMIGTKDIIHKLLPMEIFISISQARAKGFNKLYSAQNAEEYINLFAAEVKELYFWEKVDACVINDSTDDISLWDVNHHYMVESIVERGFSKLCMAVNYVPDDRMLSEMERVFEIWDMCDERMNNYCTGGLIKWFKSHRNRVILREIKRRNDVYLCMQELYSAAISLFVRKKLGTPEDFAAKMLQLVQTKD